MHFFGSERGLLATPTQCGTYPVESEFEPWDTVCPTRPRPSSSDHLRPERQPLPGRAASLRSRLRGRRRQQRRRRPQPVLGLHHPRRRRPEPQPARRSRPRPGFTATLKGIPYCPEAALRETEDPLVLGLAEQAEPELPGREPDRHRDAGAGAGYHPLYAPGKVYLAGPYKGAPLSLAVVTPAVSGPYDLGNVVVRIALRSTRPPPR